MAGCPVQIQCAAKMGQCSSSLFALCGESGKKWQSSAPAVVHHCRVIHRLTRQLGGVFTNFRHRVIIPKNITEECCGTSRRNNATDARIFSFASLFCCCEPCLRGLLWRLCGACACVVCFMILPQHKSRLIPCVSLSSLFCVACCSCCSFSLLSGPCFRHFSCLPDSRPIQTHCSPAASSPSLLLLLLLHHSDGRFFPFWFRSSLQTYGV